MKLHAGCCAGNTPNSKSPVDHSPSVERTMPSWPCPRAGDIAGELGFDVKYWSRASSACCAPGLEVSDSSEEFESVRPGIVGRRRGDKYAAGGLRVLAKLAIALENGIGERVGYCTVRKPRTDTEKSTQRCQHAVYRLVPSSKQILQCRLYAPRGREAFQDMCVIDNATSSLVEVVDRRAGGERSCNSASRRKRVDNVSR